MNRPFSIKIKAAVLMLVFGLNTVVGFACGLDVDMGYNTKHHHEDVTEVHVHADGSTHHHKKKASTHPHKDEKDNCCSDSVAKISQTDKAVPQGVKLLNPIFLTSFAAIYYNIDISFLPQRSVSNKYFVRGHHPPISDIRIAIQSFQI